MEQLESSKTKRFTSFIFIDKNNKVFTLMENSKNKLIDIGMIFLREAREDYWEANSWELTY